MNKAWNRTERQLINKDESLYWIKYFNFILAVVNMCPVLVPSELLLSTHLPISEGWAAEFIVGLWFVIPTTGFEPTQGDLTELETLRLNHSATPPYDSATPYDSRVGDTIDIPAKAAPV